MMPSHTAAGTRLDQPSLIRLPEVELSRQHRDALHAGAMDSLGDLGTALEADDYERVCWLRPRLEAVMRLLDDIGWNPRDAAERFPLTMEVSQLMLVIDFLAGRATADLAPLTDEAESAPAVRERAAFSAKVLLAADALRRQLSADAASPSEEPAESADIVSHTLTAEERRLLFAATWNHVRSTVRALPSAVLASEFAHAQSERLRLESEFRILDALDWSPDDPRPQVVLRLPSNLLSRALTRLRWADQNGPADSHEGIRVGPLSVDPVTRTIEFDGKPIAATEKEFQLVLTLASDPERVFTKDELLREIWGYPGLGTTRTLDSHACRLRRKLRAAGADRWIVNVWALGYRVRDRTVEA